MSAQLSATPSPDTPQFRYTAALAEDIETRWQDWWDANGTFQTPNPAGPLADPQRSPTGREAVRARHVPLPAGAGLHVGHPLGFIGTDVFGRYKRMTGHNVLHTMGFDAFGLPAEQYAVQTGSTRRSPPTTTSPPSAASCAAWASATTRDARSTTDPEYYRWTQWIFMQIFNSWFDPDAQTGPPDRRPDRRVRGRRPHRHPTVGRGPSCRPASAPTSSTTTGWPTSATRRSTGAPGWARSSPTKRSPPTGAATAATSRSSSATCASG